MSAFEIIREIGQTATLLVILGILTRRAKAGRP